MKIKKFIIFLLLFSSPAFTQIENIEIINQSPLDLKKPHNNCDYQICNSLKNLIDNAKSSIDFAIYGLRGQDEILNALIYAQDRGVKIRGIVDKDIHNKNYYSDTYKLYENFNNIVDDFQYDLETKSKLKDKNYSNNKCKRPKGTEGPLQCYDGIGFASKEDIHFIGDIMHNKFFIIDNEIIWTGSANISDTGTGGYNANSVVIIDSKNISEIFKSEFEQLYRGYFHRSKKIFKKEKLLFSNNDTQIEIFFSPQGYTMYRGVIPLIQNAKEYIYLSIFFLTDKDVTTALKDAHLRGVDLKIIVDSTGATNGYIKHKYLREKGLKLKVENWGGKMHMKSAVIDDQYVIHGSMNWTAAGATKNDENTLIIKNSDLALKQKSFFNSLWNSIDDQWLIDDPMPESIQSYNSCFDEIDNDFDNIIDMDETECLN